MNSHKNASTIIISSWIQKNRDIRKTEITQDITELTELFIQQHQEFLNQCKNKNSAYIEWYQNMLNCLTIEELPYAYSSVKKDFYITNLKKTLYIAHELHNEDLNLYMLNPLYLLLVVIGDVLF